MFCWAFGKNVHGKRSTTEDWSSMNKRPRKICPLGKINSPSKIGKKGQGHRQFIYFFIRTSRCSTLDLRNNRRRVATTRRCRVRRSSGVRSSASTRFSFARQTARRDDTSFGRSVTVPIRQQTTLQSTPFDRRPNQLHTASSRRLSTTTRAGSLFRGAVLCGRRLTRCSLDRSTSRSGSLLQ